MKLPDTWIETTVGIVAEDLQSGFAQKPGEENEGTTPQIRTHNVTPDGAITLKGIKHISASVRELENYSLVRGDVVFNNTNSEEWVGKTATFDHEGGYVFSNHITRIRAHRELVVPEYLAIYLHFLWSMGYSKTRAKRWVSQAGIENKVLASFKLPLPTLIEQQRIVELLQQGTAVTKLQDDYHALLTRTKRQLFVDMFGDPDPKVNAQWPTVTLGSLVTVATGGTPAREQLDSYGNTHSWVKSTDLKDNLILTTEECVSELGIQRSNAKIFPKNTVMLAMYGQGQTRGRTGKLMIDAACNQACAALLPSDELLADYLWVWLQLSYESVRSLGRGGQQENLNLDIVRGISLPKPSIPLQREFSRRLAALLDTVNLSRTSRTNMGVLLGVLRVEALTGDATSAWREKHAGEISVAAEKRNILLRERGVNLVHASIGPSYSPAPQSHGAQLARRWLMSELSAFQREVLVAFADYSKSTGKPVLAEDSDQFARFCEEGQVSKRLQTFGAALHNRIRRTLSQLASLGLIAKVALPRQNIETGEREYLKAFRALRPEESARMADVVDLRKVLGIERDSPEEPA